VKTPWTRTDAGVKGEGTDPESTEDLTTERQGIYIKISGEKHKRREELQHCENEPS